MARESKVRLDVEFGDVSQAEIDKLGKQVKEGLESVKLDPTWAQKYADVRSEIVRLQKEGTELESSRKKTIGEITKLEARSLSNREKMQRVTDTITNTQIDSARLEQRFARQQFDLQSKINADTAKLNDLKESGMDDEKTIAEMQKLRDRITSNTLKKEDLITQQKRLALRTTEKTVKLNQQLDEIESEDVRLNKEINSLLNDRNTSVDKLRSNQDAIIEQQRTAAGLENQRIATQQAIAAEIRKADPSISQEDALKRAKEMLPIVGKQSKFEQKNEQLLKRTKKDRKAILKDRLTELTIHDKMLKRQGIGFMERRKIIGAEKVNAKKSLGLVSVREQATEKAAKGMGKAVSGQLGQIAAVVGKLAGPLIALGGIAGFVMLMLQDNKQIMAARKNLFTLAQTGDATWKKMEKGQTTTIGQVEAFRGSLRGLWGQVGMTYEDALKNVGALTKAGIELDVTTAKGRESFTGLMADVESMALMSGQSFEEMAATVGEWKTEFRKDVDEMSDTFLSLRSSAAKTDIMTTRFFSSVMNAAQGLAIYGTQIEDVGTAFAALTNGVKMPQKEASKLASEMINATDQMSSAQKVMVAQIGGAKGLLEEQRKSKQEEVDRLELLEKQGKLTAASRKSLEKNRGELQEINTLLTTKYPDELEAQTRYFEALDPGQQIELRLRALSKAAPDMFKDVDIADPKQLAGALALNREKMAEVGKQFGFDKKQLMLVEQLAKAGTSIADLPTKMAKKEEEAEKKRLKAQERRQASIIQQGTKSIMDSLGQKIGYWVEQIYLWLEEKMIPFFEMVADYFGKDYKYKDATAAKLAERIKELETEETKLATRQKELETKEADAGLTKDEEKELAAVKERRGAIRVAKSGMESRLASSKEEKGSGLGGKAASFLTGGLLKTKEKQSAERNLRALAQEKRLALQSAIGKAGFDKATKEFADYAFRLFSSHPYMTKIGEGDDKAQKWLRNNWDELVMRVSQGFIPVSLSAKTGDVRKLFSSYLGFQKGGFTGVGEPGKIAGFAHKGEFVFDKQATDKAGPENLANLMTAIKSPSADVPSAATSINQAPIDVDTSMRALVSIMNFDGIISAVNRLPGAIASAMPATQVAGGAAAQNNVTNNVTLNVNQRDKQEIEQIIYKVLYDKSGANI